jgi:chemotaxis methyl-accepting protein methylase
MQYTYVLPTSMAFEGEGLFGYAFGPLKQKDLDIYYADVKKGHDFFMKSKKITRTYYVLEGSGYFVIDNLKYEVTRGMLVEVPPKVEYCYSGKMKLLVFSRPRWRRHNDKFIKWNADVFQESVCWMPDGGPLIARLARMRFFGKSPVSAYLRMNQALWTKLPNGLVSAQPVQAYGRLLHRFAKVQSVRAQAHATFFLRNRPQLELIRRLLERRSTGGTVRIAVLGCSTGAEVYSIARTIRSARNDINLILDAVDISEEAVKVGECGVYSLARSKLTETNIFERMTEAEIREFFDADGDRLTVKSWIREGIRWRVGDVRAAEFVDILGQHDLVIANNFLCHMNYSAAERCLRNIAQLVRPNGYLFVSGVDLDVRTEVVRDLDWKPLEELLEEIHDGDSCMGAIWPFQYAGLEPLNKQRRDWKLRYAAAFQFETSSERDRRLPAFNVAGADTL